MIVGFAAETGDEHGSVLDHGRAKLARKGCDLLVVNEVGRRQDVRPGRQHGRTCCARAPSHVVDAGPASKEAVAAAVWDAVTGDPLTLGRLSGRAAVARRRAPVSTVSIRCIRRRF